jgi:hypothetical protein
VLTYIDGQATTGVVAVARPVDVVTTQALGAFTPRGTHMIPSGQAVPTQAVPTQTFQVKATTPSPVLGDQLSSPPV